jgi:hypothetical protein
LISLGWKTPIILGNPIGYKKNTNLSPLIDAYIYSCILGYMSEEEIITIVIEEAFYIHKKIGPGLLENVYKTCLAYRLRKRGLEVETEKPVPVC